MHVGAGKSARDETGESASTEAEAGGARTVSQTDLGCGVYRLRCNDALLEGGALRGVGAGVHEFEAFGKAFFLLDSESD